MQEEFNVKPYKMLKYCDTRWLGLECCVIRILNRWDCLEKYFSVAKDGDWILKSMKKKNTKPLLQFLRALLKKINEYNLKWQESESIF